MRLLFETYCGHPRVTIVRWHPDVVLPHMKDKLLYVDRHGVHCFVQCTQCKAFISGQLFEPIFDSKS
jgi:hypothetical protein